MKTVTLVLVIHDHQPVGNFDGVFRQAYADAYEPFLAFLENHPRLRLALHTSGPLLQWIALHEPGYLKRLRVLVDRGQVELWGGAFFEPVLPAVPEADRRGQVQAMADWIELELGRRPRGLWLAERVWEPGLPSSLSAAGAEYTAVDDAHFVAAGLPRDDLWGYFLTEDQGATMGVFPIHRELRYLIPFEEPERTVDLLRRVAEGGEGRIAVMGDDGEKLGLWPGTHKLCYRDGWLERWVAALEAHSWIELRTPAEAIAHRPPLGLAYLPTASYHEMQEWALPPARQALHHRATESLAGEFGAEEARDLLRGGHWRNFLARYSESNRLHKRVQRASRLLWRRAAEGDEAWKESRTRLWRAQCNCPYWHGVFGGLYLPHLRSALYRELIAVEAYVAPGTRNLERGDLDLDGFEDALLEAGSWACWISTRGARMWALDDRDTLKNYGDTLSRRRELYHDQIERAAEGGGEGEPIGGALRIKDAAVADLEIEYDAHGRDSFLDRWQDEAGECHDWAGERFEITGEGPAEVVLGCAETAAPAIEKRYSAGVDHSLEVDYVLTSSRSRRGTLQVDLNLGLHVPQAEDRYVEVAGERADPPHFAARAHHSAVSCTAFVDLYENLRLELDIDRPASLERAPIETVSLSEGGAERVFQGVEARFAFPAALEPGTPWRLRFRVRSGRAREETR